MANVVPFRGILYNPEKIDHVSNVVAPPYDVISPEKQDELHDRHPQNVVRLILGRSVPTDTEEENPHSRAAGYFQSWLADQFLVQDKTLAYYLTSVEFMAEGQQKVRYGLMALVALEPFDKGIILPHEQTFSKVKSERLQLLKKCKANFSPIFTFYPDQEEIITILKQEAENQTPAFDFLDDVDERHRLWRITSPEVVEKIYGLMADKQLFIADGHHRYETALNYREWVRENDPDYSETHPANFVMMYLCSMEDDGLVIFPTHRMVTTVDDDILARFIENARDYFDVSDIPFAPGAYDQGLQEILEAIKKETDRTVFGVFIKNRQAFYLLQLKPGAADNVFGDKIPDVLKQLDVTILTRLIFAQLLSISQEGMDDTGFIKYSSKAEKAVEQVVSGQADVAFIMNSAKLEHVKNIADNGLIMPRKTTYFYPKAITGLVMNTLTPLEG